MSFRSSLFTCGSILLCGLGVARGDVIPAGAQAILEAYPSQNLSFSNNQIVFSDGSAIAYDDGREKSFTDVVEEADVEDMFSLKYDMSVPPGVMADGGRSRCESFYKKMYGDSEGAVRKNMVRVNWFGQKLLVSTVNNVDRQLMAVAKEIAAKPHLKKYMEKSSSFNWRVVRGTKNRLSAHSYGITLDVNTSYSDYWLWKNPKKSELDTDIKYVNRIPMEIVEIFQKYGFIWGGYWFHYDTMHFEYRPEILIYHGVKPVLLK